MEDSQALEWLNRFIELAPARCKTCAFKQVLGDEWKFVPPESIAGVNAKYFIVGQNPGVIELKLGKPFVGRSGKLLDRLLRESSIARDECWISNACKCKALSNHAKETSSGYANLEIMKGAAYSCITRHLIHELDEWSLQYAITGQRKAIIVLGGIAARALRIPTYSQSMKAARFIVINDGRFPGIPILREAHPAYLLRTGWDDYPKVLQSFKQLRSLVIVK